MGITIAGRDVIANRFSRFKDWAYNVASFVIGSLLTIAIQKLCSN